MTRAKNLFPSPPPASPKIYAYSLPGLPTHDGFIKIGYTTRNPDSRIRQQTLTAGLKPRKLLTLSAMRPDGSSFRDTDVHALLEHSGFTRHPDGQEWFRCSRDDVIRAVEAVRNRTYSLTARDKDFPMRPEQEQAVRITAEYFTSPGSIPKFLWNAKMRFGKTFAAYQLCKRMALTKILVVTFKPAAEDAWREDILTHKDFDGWQFISNHTAEVKGLRIDDEFAFRDKGKPVVVFGSFQDLLGRTRGGGIKAKNEFIHDTRWDIAIFDEYHFGAWRDGAQGLFSDDEESGSDPEEFSGDDDSGSDEILPIDSHYRLYLSGTPFRALNSGEFIEEQIYSWTYPDEQRAKESWHGEGVNPYASMPRMVLMTYQIPDEIREIASAGEYDGFDLDEFFSADDEGFKHEEYVRRWLALIRGDYAPLTAETFRQGRGEDRHMPYADSVLSGALRHTVWYLKDVASCRAMRDVLESEPFFRDYRVVLCAGDACGCGVEALRPLQEAMTDDPAETKTITLTCGKLLTAVTVRAWSGIFMLRNLKSPETYFQAAFRVQSPYTVYDDEGGMEILKPECYVFDFALERALKQVADYSCRLNLNEDDPEKKADEFINFLPVLAFDGAEMNELDAGAVLDYAMTGVSAVLLARRWKSGLLLNVNAETLGRVLRDERAMRAVERITALRALNKDIETIINLTRDINTRRKEGKSSAKKITQEEKERRDKLKKIRDKLIKFLTRIPLFMYLTDEREKSLTDIIREISPGLFKKVTGITIQEFELLNRLEVFNTRMINAAIYGFKRYEDASLAYTGLAKNETQVWGLYDKTIGRDEIYEE